MLETDPKKKKIVVFAEAPANESKYKIQPDKEYFNQINQGIPKELVGVYDEYLTKNTERENLKKSTFVSPHSLDDYLYKTPGADIEKIPPELKTIYDSYLLKSGEHGNLANERKTALKTVISNFEKENPGVDYNKLSNEEYLQKIDKPMSDMLGPDFDKKSSKMLSEVSGLKNQFNSYNQKERERLNVLDEEIKGTMDKFYNTPLNPKIINQTFPTEGNNILEYYKDDPNVEVIKEDVYKDRYTLADIEKKAKDADVIINLNHSGAYTMGFDNEEYAQTLAKCKATDIYMGSCNYDKYVPNFKALKGKNFYYRPDSSYFGFDPTAKDSKGNKDFLSAMYGRYQEPNSEVKRGKAVEGKHYKKVKF